VARTVKREGEKLIGKSKKAKNATPADLRRRKFARATGRGLRRPNLSRKRPLTELPQKIGQGDHGKD
jgi:hypothetical protein